MSLSLHHFTEKAQETLLAAQEEAKQRNHLKVEAEHLLLSLLKQEGGLISPYLQQLGVVVETMQNDLEEELQHLSPSDQSANQVYISKSLQAIIQQAEKEAFLRSEQYANTEHLLFSLLLSPNSTPFRILQNHQITVEKVKELLTTLSQKEQRHAMNPSSKSALGAYCTDLLEQVKQNQIDPVIGRDEEVRRVIQLLSRRMKNNPILIGEPGVGKTAIVEGLAHRIVIGDVPETLQTKQLLSLDLGSLIAGTNYRGEFESRLKQLLKEIEESAGQIILFIDELHLLMGAGGTEGSLDAANMLKPALARGLLRSIGATTLDEYQKYIEKDTAMVRRFQPVLIHEPDVEATISILRGLKNRYELHHKVKIKDAALLAATKLSQRYVNERYLPDKAIDLIDEAASTLRIQIDSLPTEVDQLERKILQFNIEQKALSKEEDRKSLQRLQEIQREVGELQTKSLELKQAWEQEKIQLQEMYQLREQMEKIKQQELEAQRAGDLELAAKLHYEVLAGVNSQLKEKTQQLQSKGLRLLKEEVDEEDIAKVVSQWTGIPVNRMLEEERQKLVTMESRLSQRIVGQINAISSVARAIRRSRVGIHNPKLPIGSFMFIGSSGVGKTELAYALSEFLFDDEKALLRMDMSEYMEKNSVNRLLGASPGYVGYEAGGMLTEAIRRNPYAVVLLDEIEKAHPDVFNIFLQILDDGYVTDAKGRDVNFRNTLLIMTTNLGQEKINAADQEGKNEEEIQKIAKQELLTHFKPEFLNRIDELVIFHRLQLKHILQICDHELQKIQSWLLPQNIKLWVAKEARVWLAQRGYEIVYGARPLKRVLQRYIQDEIAQRMLAGSLQSGKVCKVEVHDGELKFT